MTPALPQGNLDVAILKAGAATPSRCVKGGMQKCGHRQGGGGYIGSPGIPSCLLPSSLSDPISSSSTLPSRSAAPASSSSSVQHPTSTLAKGAGVLGALGSALSWGYAEVFDPSAKLVKRTPCGRPVADIHVVALDAGRLRVTLLTDVSVECWTVRSLAYGE